MTVDLIHRFGDRHTIIVLFSSVAFTEMSRLFQHACLWTALRSRRSDGTHTGAGITCSFPHREALARLRVGHGTISRWGGGVNHCLARQRWQSERPAGRSRVRRKLTSVEALSCRRSKRTSLKRGKKKSSFAYEFNLILTATYFVHCLGIFPNLVVAAVKWACFGLRLIPAKRPRRTLVCAVNRETAQRTSLVAPADGRRRRRFPHVLTAKPNIVGFELWLHLLEMMR